MLRTAKSSDLPFIQQLCRRVFSRYGSYDRYVEDWFQRDFVSTIVAELEGSNAGFFMLALPSEGAEGVAELLAIAVAPELQGRGLGKALLERAIDLAGEPDRDLAEIRLSVAEGNSRAQRLFARSAFRIDSASGIYPAGQRALFMIKTLRPNPSKEERR